MNQPVRAVRVAVVAAALAAAYVITLYCVRAVPDWAIAMLGGPSRPLERHGGLSLTFRPAPGSEDAAARYVAERGAVAREENGRIIVEMPGLPEAAAMETIDLLRYGGLVMKEVVRTNYAAEIGERDGVTLEVDQWMTDDGQPRADAYLQAFSADAMEAALAGWQPPPGTELAFEWVEPTSYGENARPYLRSYLVKSVAEVDGSMIADAMLSYDPNTNRPIVLLDFNRAGGEKLCQLTARMTGEKLATITGGRVRSAPIITGRICGGRASVTMGGNDHQRQEADAAALVAVLRSGAIPPGEIESHAWTPAADVTREVWLARALFGLIAALVAALVMFVAVRLAKPTTRARAVSTGKLPWRRIAVTALAPISLLVAGNIPLPGLDVVELEHVLRRSLGTHESVIALGLTPIISGYLLVELVALAWPSLRWRRHDPAGRVALGRAAAAASIVLALVQGYFAASYWDQLGTPAFGFGPTTEITAHHGMMLKLLYMVTLAAGTMGLALIAGIIREHGLGNGYAALLAAGYLLDLAEPYAHDGYATLFLAFTRETAVGLVAAIAIIFATRALLRWRVDRLRVPTCGIAPLGDSQAIVTLLVLLASLGISGFDTTLQRYTALISSDVAHATILFASVPVWSWLFARPRLLVGVELGAWVRATGLTLVVFVAAWYVGTTYALAIMLITAAALDVLDELRARRQELVVAGAVHQAQYVGMLERAFDEANIPVHFHASHIRTLVAFFGAWAPIIVLVPEARREAAEKLVYATITTEHHAVVRAFARAARPTPGRRFAPAWARTT